MIRISLTLVLLFSISSLVFGQTARKINARQISDEQAVHQVEDQLAAAFDHNDADALDRLWADEYTFVNPGGVFMTKAQRLATFRSGDLKLDSYSRDQEKISIYGTTAVVRYSIFGERSKNRAGYHQPTPGNHRVGQTKRPLASCSPANNPHRAMRHGEDRDTEHLHWRIVLIPSRDNHVKISQLRSSLSSFQTHQRNSPAS